MTPATLEPERLRRLLEGSDELALVDVHELEDFRAGHLYAAAYLPASWTEGRRRRVETWVPRRDTPVVLVGPPGVVEAEARTWSSWGYRDVAVLAGGTPAWARDGGRAFRNLCVPSKALAESARAAYATPSVSVDALASALADPSRAPLLVDVRSPEEYGEATVPGATSIPGGELVARIAAHLGDDRRPVVVTCAGRTRAIFGAQSLRDAGLPNPVTFLEGGTTAWAESGRPLERGATPHGADAPLPAADHAADLVAALRARSPDLVTVVDRDGLDLLLAEQDRTTYVVDPRLVPGPDPVPGVEVHHVPAGQLVEAVDEHLPVLRARVVLVDEAPHLRAHAIARWLTASRLLEVYVLDTSRSHTFRRGTIPEPTPRPDPAAPPEGSRALEEDYRAWSVALPALAAAEPGGGFAL
ncbi:rhodanese-like domain-containing protein [Mumia sp. DW29H23]|uniref:rhodanese-like domain-containing protein n=1 Tax=Mumia sp. DW29H23 TaxID=3421241 RepID=UPI003D695F4D